MRPRQLTLHPMTAKKLLRLKREAESDGAYRVAKRIHAVLLNHDDYTSGQIMAILKAPRSRVSEWLRNYEQFGYDGLLEGYRPGRPAALSAANQQALADIIESGPVAYGYLSGVWTSPMITRVIQEQFGVTYHPGYVCRLLHTMGFSVQRPKRKLARADPQKQDRWHRYTYPNQKKTPERRARH
ncbi:MAG: winged helix-turn-helix domain-containing protein [Phycisphaerae bacterium]|nr:winged helix-turn-helix domain-containing protein [Phycisphaerae bacterium]